jgi:hypothetical protein
MTKTHSLVGKCQTSASLTDFLVQVRSGRRYSTGEPSRRFRRHDFIEEAHFIGPFLFTFLYT